MSVSSIPISLIYKNFLRLLCPGIDSADTGCSPRKFCSWETIKCNQLLLIRLVYINVVNWVASDFKCHIAWACYWEVFVLAIMINTDHFLFQGGGGKERPQQYWVRSRRSECYHWKWKWAQESKDLPSLAQNLFFWAEGTDPVDSIFLTWKWQAHVTKTQHYCHSSWKHIKLLCFSQDCSLFPAEGALIYWFSDDHVKLARSKIKRFWIGTLMSSCIHFYRWYLLKARVNYEIGTNSVLDFSVLIYRN